MDSNDRRYPLEDCIERLDDPTPSGGAYWMALFSDANRQPCPKERAVYVELHEYDAAGNLLTTTYLGPDPNARPSQFEQDRT